MRHWIYVGAAIGAIIWYGGDAEGAERTRDWQFLTLNVARECDTGFVQARRDGSGGPVNVSWRRENPCTGVEIGQGAIDGLPTSALTGRVQDGSLTLRVNRPEFKANVRVTAFPTGDRRRVLEERNGTGRNIYPGQPTVTFTENTTMKFGTVSGTTSLGQNWQDGRLNREYRHERW